MAEAEEDDIWDFSTPSADQPPEHSERSSSGSEEDLKALPASKRRRLARRLINVPDVVLLDDDSESESSDSGLEFVEAPKEAGTDGPKAGDLDFLEASLRQQQALPRKASQRDAETEAVLMRNRAALARVKAIMDDPLPEQAVYAYAEQPSTSQQLEQSDSNAAAQPAPEGERIVVKLRIEQQEEPIKLRIAVDGPLGRLFDKFKEMALKQGWVQAETTPKFMFDGEVLRPEETAEGQEIEEDCIIEVHW